MTKEELLDFAKEVKGVSTYLQNLAQVLEEELSKDENTQGDPVDPRNEEVPTPPVTLEQVRGVLASKSQEGKTPEVRELLTKYGANKLSEVAESKYASLLEEAEDL